MNKAIETLADALSPDGVAGKLGNNFSEHERDHLISQARKALTALANMPLDRSLIAAAETGYNDAAEEKDDRYCNDHHIAFALRAAFEHLVKGSSKDRERKPTPTFWWQDADLNLPDYENRTKIEEWEACYASLFRKMNQITSGKRVDPELVKRAESMLEYYDKENALEPLSLIKTIRDLLKHVKGE